MKPHDDLKRLLNFCKLQFSLNFYNWTVFTCDVDACKNISGISSFLIILNKKPKTVYVIFFKKEC